MADRPLRNDGVTLACPICGQPFGPSGRRCHPPPLPLGPSRVPRPATVYECAGCGTRFLGQQRCPDCQQFCRRVGPGGLCPHCDEPVAVTDLFPVTVPPAPSATREPTGSGGSPAG